VRRERRAVRTNNLFNTWRDAHHPLDAHGKVPAARCDPTAGHILSGDTMKYRSALLLALTMGVSALAHAGPYADDLSKCLVSSTTKDDRIDLVKWIFAAMGTHPAVKSLVSVTPEQLDATSQSVAKLFTRLLAQSCHDQTQKAVQYEGPGTIQTSFQVLGQVAARELFTDPSVVTAMSSLSKYVDEKQLAGLFPNKPATSTNTRPAASVNTKP
jgi:hypothetical protein